MAELNGERAGVLRERNCARVIEALRRQGLASRSDLARMTGLSRTTVGSLVAELQARGLVLEEADGRRQGGRGRPPVFVRFDPAAGVAVGIDFDHDRVRVALADLSSTVLAEDCAEIDVDHSASDAIDAALEILAALQESAGVGDALDSGPGVGVDVAVRCFDVGADALGIARVGGGGSVRPEHVIDIEFKYEKPLQ